MKLLILMGVLLASISVRATQTVNVMTPLESGPQVRVVTLHNGKGLVGVRVDVFRSESLLGEEKHVSTLVSEDGGWIKLPALVPGYYHLEGVVADKARTHDDAIHGDLYLNVFGQSQAPMLFTIELVDPVAQREHISEELIIKAEQKPITSVIKEFRGTVYDASGAVIPEAEIRVMRKGTQGKVTVALLKSDETGEFRKNLLDGEYVAQISRAGFETRVFLFKVTSGKGDQQLTVTLNVASASEEVSISQAALPQRH